jgi:hypothetical protein
MGLRPIEGVKAASTRSLLRSKQKCHPDRRGHGPAAHRMGESRFHSFSPAFQTEVSSRPERSAVEGPAVHHPPLANVR